MEILINNYKPAVPPVPNYTHVECRCNYCESLILFTLQDFGSSIYGIACPACHQHDLRSHDNRDHIKPLWKTVEYKDSEGRVVIPNVK